MMKRFFATLCALALMLCLLPATAFAAGEGNMDSGGGGMGQGTSTNKWTPGNDGVRITVVDAETGAAVSSPMDYSNTVQSSSVLYFGKVSKLQYLSGTSLSPQAGATYSCRTPASPMPTIVSSTGRNNIESIKRYFCSEYACMMIAGDAGVSYEAMLAGKYKLLVEPLAYFTHNGLYYCMTATEAALYDQLSGGTLRRTMTSLTHKKVCLTLADGKETTLLLGLQTKIKPDKRYQFYFRSGSASRLGNEYLDAALSTNVFLGYEECAGEPDTPQ